jgi:N-acetylglucosamine-6-phosphate deacetylase
MQEMQPMELKLPGLVDLQVNGYGGVDFSSSELTPERFYHACRQLIQKGVTAFCPTIITSREEVYKANLAIMAAAFALPEFRDHLLGIHAEGPFLSKMPGAIGCHNPDWVQTAHGGFLEKMQNWAEGNIRIVTIAAEIPGAAELTRRACRMGITVFLGHQLAGVEAIKTLAAAGAKAVTHLGNGMPAMANRHDNPLLHALAVDEIAATIITDGHHLPAHLIKTIIRCKGIDNVAVISDASPLAGMPPGDYTTLGNPARLEPSGLLHNPKLNCLVGSSATLVECLDYAKSLGLFTQADLVKLFYENPLRLIDKLH